MTVIRGSTNQPRKKSRLTRRSRLGSNHVSERFYVVNRYGPIENFPPDILGKQRKLALLFKKLATLRTDAPLFKNSETLRWRDAKRLRADDDALLTPGPNFKTLTSPAIKVSGSPIGVTSRSTFPRDSRGNFADFAVLPDDHGQAALAKFDAFLFRRATMCLRCDAGFRRHLALRNRLQAVMQIFLHEKRRRLVAE